MSFLDKLKGTFGKAKDKSDADRRQEPRTDPDEVEQVYDKVSDAAEKIAPGADGADRPAKPAPTAAGAARAHRQHATTRNLTDHRCVGPPFGAAPSRQGPAVGADVVAVGVELATGPAQDAGRRAETGDQRLHRCVADERRSCRAPRCADRHRCRPCPSPGRPRRRPRRARRRPRPACGVEHHALINASSSSRCCARPANPANRSSSPTPSSASTRAATLSLLVDTATHFPSRHW